MTKEKIAVAMIILQDMVAHGVIDAATCDACTKKLTRRCGYDPDIKAA